MESLELPASYTVPISTLIVIFVVILVKKIGSRRRNPLPPSPPSVPILGHFHLFKPEVPFQRTLQALSSAHGHVLRLKLGFRTVVVVSSPAGVEDCLVKNDLVLADRPLTRASKHLSYDTTALSSASYGDHFRNLRKILNLEIFSAPRQSKLLCLREEGVKLLVKSLVDSLESTQDKFGFAKVDIRSRISKMSLNGILKIVSGKRFYAEDGELRERIRERMGLSAAITNPADFFPFLWWFNYNGYEKRLVKLKTDMDEVLQGMVDQHRRDPSNGPSTENSLIDNLLRMQEADFSSMTDVMIKGLILDTINAGTDTSAITIEWAMSLLLNNPEKLRKARNEIDTVIGGFDRLVQESDLPSLKYIQCIINETLRIYPSTPLLLPHQASADCIIQGYRVERGTMVLINVYALQRDPNVWEDPMRFEPERFENVEEDINHGYKFIPFSMGRRICPGASFAYKVIGLALATLIQCFDWGRVGDKEVDMSESPGLTMLKVKPLETMVRPRREMINVLSTL